MVTPEGQLRLPYHQPPLDQPEHRGDSTWDCLGVVALRLKPCGNMTGDRAESTQALGREGPIWALEHLALAMGMAQLQPGAKDTWMGCSQAQAVLRHDSLLTSSQPVSHLLFCLIFGDPTPFNRVMLEDRSTRIALVTQECWGVYTFRHFLSCASGGPGLVSTGERAHCPLLYPPSAFPLPLDFQYGVRHRSTFTLGAPPGRDRGTGGRTGVRELLSGRWGLLTSLCPKMVI